MAIGFEDADILAILKLGGVDEFGRQLGEVNQKVKDGADKLATAVNVGIAAGAAALGLAVVNAASFEKAMANVNTIANLDPRGLEAMSESVKGIAMVNPINMETLTGGLYDLVSSGVPAANATAALALAAQAASAGLTGVDTAVQAGMANINAYGLPVSELTRVFDLQFQAVNVGVMTYGQLATSIGNVLPAAQNLKVPLDQLYAATAQLTLSGIDPQSSTTYLGRLFSQLSDPEVTSKIEQNGIKVWGPDGSFRGLVDVLKDLDAAAKGMSDEQRANFFNSIGFTEQSNKALLALIGNLNGENGFLATMEKMKDSPGAVAAAFKKQSETLSGQADILKNILHVGFIDVGNAITPVLKSIVELANSNPEATKTLAASISTMAIGFGGLAAAYKGIQALQLAVVAMAASPVGLLALGLAGVATAIVAINTAVEANQAAFLAEIGATSDNIEKVGALADTIESLRGKKELTKDETIKLKDAEKELGDLMGDAGLKLADYAGNLGDIKDAYENIQKVNLNQELKDLQEELKNSSTFWSGVSGGLAAIAPSLSTTISDANIGRVGDLADRIKKVQDEINELNKPDKLPGAATGISNLGDAAGGSDGTGGAAGKIKKTKEELAELKKYTEYKNFKEVESMKGFDFIQQIHNNAMAADTSVRGLKSASMELVGAFPEVKTSGDNAALGIDSIGVAALAGVSALETYNPKLGAFANNLWKVVGDEKVTKSEYAGIIRSIGDMASEQNPKVGALIGTFAAFVEGGPVMAGISLISTIIGSMGSTQRVIVDDWGEVVNVLGKAGDKMRAFNDAITEINNSMQLDVVDTLQAKLESVSFAIAQNIADQNELAKRAGAGDAGAAMQQKKLKDELEKLRNEYNSLSTTVKDYTDAFTLDETYADVTEEIDLLSKKYNELYDKFGEKANLEGLQGLLGDTVTSGEALLKTLDPNSKAFEELNGKIAAARELLQGLVQDVQNANNTPVNIPTVNTPTVDDDIPTTPSGGGGKFDTRHSGGFPTAHTGFLAPNETMVKMLKNEMVLRPEATARFGAAKLLEFNSTLDPQALSGGSRYQPMAAKFDVTVHEATKSTWVEITDRHVEPRMKERTRRFEVKANPYGD